MERQTRICGTLPNGKEVTLKKRLGPSFMNFSGIEYENLPPIFHQYPLQITDVRGSRDGANTIVLSKYIDKTSGTTQVGFEKFRVTETVDELYAAFSRAGQVVTVQQSFGVMIRSFTERFIGRQPD